MDNLTSYELPVEWQDMVAKVQWSWPRYDALEVKLVCGCWWEVDATHKVNHLPMHILEGAWADKIFAALTVDFTDHISKGCNDD